jgi:hypothetical protein
MLFPTTPPTASSLIALVLPVLLLTPSISASTKDITNPTQNQRWLQCIHVDPHQIADKLACGDKGSIAYCLGNLRPSEEWTAADQVATCLVNAGCSEAEAEIETLWTLRRCDSADGGSVDLRKRQRTTAVATEENETTQPATNKLPTATTAKTAGPKTTLTAATAEPTTAAPATTQKPAAATPSSTSPGVETVVVTAQDTSSPTTPAAATTAQTTGKPPVCLTESMLEITSCPVQSTGVSSGKPMSCFPTTVPTQVCAEGLICKVDGQGAMGCMYADTKFSAAGVIIALFFAVSVTAAISLMVFLCCRERKEQSRIAKAAEAAAIAKEAAFAAAAGKGVKGAPAVRVREVSGASEDRRPLMPDGQGYGGGFGGHDGGVNPFGDQHMVR